MSLYKDGEFEIIQDRSSLVIINRSGTYENHSHMAKRTNRNGIDLRDCLMVIDFVKRHKMPTSGYICKACMRLSLDDRYCEALKQKIDKLIQHKYINVNKGVAR